MSRSAGPGSPVWFRCWAERQIGGSFLKHRVELTGRTRPYKSRRVLGTRSVLTSYEYRCECGHVGWSNHIDLAHMANDDQALRRVGRIR